MAFFVIVGFIVLALLLNRRRSTRSIGEVAPGTMIVTCSDGSTKEHEYRGEINSYYHEETAADYLCQPEKHVLVEIKDVNGKVYSYSQKDMNRLGWN
jgi:hypothetical protein